MKLDFVSGALFVLGALLPSFLISLLAGFAMRRVAPALGLIDHPASRKVHTTPTPLGGGVAIWLGVVTVFAFGTLALTALDLASLPLPEAIRVHLPGLRTKLPELWALLGAGTTLMLLGLADDRFKLPWQARLAVQFGVAAFCVWRLGWWATIFLHFPPLTFAISVLWIVALVNSFNMLDNMDALSSGVAAMASLLFASVLLTPGPGEPQLFSGGFLLVLLGALLGFLWHNWTPARIFMGDAGSYFVGFSMAAATLLATFTDFGQGRHTILAPLCIMAVPLYDLATVVYIRLREGRSPFHADKSHFSHRLVELGMSKKQAVLTIYLTTFTCGVGALLLYRTDGVGAAFIVTMVLGVLAVIAVLESTSRRRARRDRERLDERGAAPADAALPSASEKR
jgi:UDP-GlcNAc:undecaprenyl-phosphate GlcNAc-1-phosphate transferase